MLEINAIEYSKNPIAIGEAFLLEVTVSEILGTWNDLENKTWDNVLNSSWQDLNLKILPPSYGLWGEQSSKTWENLSTKIWRDV